MSELSKEQMAALAKMEKYFSDTHDYLYREHARAAKAKDGFFCKLYESQIAAHDQAWVQWTFCLQDLKIPVDVSRGWRKPAVQIIVKEGSEQK
jgi:hypothetical protein